MHLFLALALTLPTWAAPMEDKQYPEERVYGAQDRGFRQYGAPSIHGTGHFALTFDDGPHLQHTPRLLNLLKAHGVKATFFVVTSRIDNSTYPLLKRMLDEGHIVASHGREHLNSNEIDEPAFRANLRDSLIALRDVYRRAGHAWDKIYYRYPYAAYGLRPDYHQMNVLQQVSQELFGDNCVQFAFWDVDSVDWLPGLTSEEVFMNLRAHMEGGRAIDFRTVRDAQGRVTYIKVPYILQNPPQGGVVLQHDIQQRTLEGTRLFLEYAKERGLVLTTLPEIREFAVQRECRFSAR